MIQRCLGLVVACLLLTSCLLPTLPPMESIAPTATAEAEAPPSSPSRPPTGDNITLAYGETVTVADGRLTLTFQDVLEDSRCPADVLCAWSGWVRIQLLVQVQNEPAQTLEITSFTDNDGNILPPTANNEANPAVEAGPYLIELRQVTPYPASHAEPTPLADYQIVVQVHEQSGRPPPPPSRRLWSRPRRSDQPPVPKRRSCHCSVIATGRSLSMRPAHAKSRPCC